MADCAQIVSGLETIAQYGVATPSISALIDVGTTDFLNVFEEEIIEELMSVRGATCRVFEGVYGGGKSHLLRLLEHRARMRRMAVVRTDLSQDLSLEDWREIVKHILQNIEALDSLKQTVKGLPRVLTVARELFSATAANIRKAQLPHSGFAGAIQLRLGPTSMASEEGVEQLDQFLMGERITAAFLSRYGITGIKNPLSVRNAETVLRTVLSALAQCGFRGTLLTFDETEKTLEAPRARPSAKVIKAANLLRRFIDGCVSGTVVGTVAVFAVLPDFTARCARAYPALGQRLRITFRKSSDSGWRFPVLPLEAVTTTPSMDGFLDGAIERMLELVKRCNGELDGLVSEMRSLGARVLERNAGLGCRRDVMKLLATLALKRI